MYGCLVFSSCESKKTNRFLFDHFGNLATFVVRTCDQNLHPTVVIYLFYILGLFKKLFIFNI
jgi:hypothetical protein